MSMRQRCVRLALFISLIVGWVFVGDSRTPAAVRAQTDVLPRFEPAECWFNVAEGLTVACGYVVVPEDRSDPANDATIRLAVAVFRSLAEDRLPDPLMMLAGGPGEKAIVNAVALASLLGVLSPERDFIVFDQRGVGFSEPALECPEWEAAALELLNSADPDMALEEQFRATMACRDRLVEEGYNLSAFNTTQNAADVNDIRIALGYDQVNLLGISYGSMLAQATLRDYPEAVRSAIIDSVLPLSGSLFVDSYTTVSNALMRLIDACAADEACNAAYPDLRDVLFEVIDRLNAEPVAITLTNPLTGETHPALLTGDAVMSYLSFFLYQASIIPLMPQTIYDLQRGNYDLMTQLGGTFLLALGGLSRGMEYSVFCTEDLIGRTPEDLLEQIMALPPQLRGAADPEQMIEYSAFAVCENWPVEEADPSVKAPVVSDVPTLVLSGEFDPVTPPEYGRQVAATLSNSYFFEFPGLGHSVNLASACARSISQAFLSDPLSAPDAACLDEMTGPAFTLPQEGGLTLLPFTSDTFGFSGLVPDGWEEIAPGVYRGDALGTTALIEQAMPGGVDNAVQLLGSQLGMEIPASVSSREANGLTWQLYELEVQALQLDLALAESGGMVYIILLQSPNADNRAELYEQVYLPVIDALTPAE